MAGNKPHMAPPGRGGPGMMHGFQKPKNTKETILRLIGYLTRHKLLLILVVVFMLLSAGSTLAGTYYLKPLINNFIGTGLTDTREFLISLITLALIYAAGAAAVYLQSAITVRLAQRGCNRLRRELFDRLQALPLSFFDSHPHGELMSRFANDADQVQMALEQSLPSFLSSALMFVGIVAMLLLISPWLFLVTALMLAGTMLVMKRMGGKSRKHFRTQQQALGEMDGYIQETIEGLRVVKAFSHEAAARTTFDSLNEKYQAAATSANFYGAATMPVAANLNNISYAFTAAFGGLLALIAGLDIGSLAVYLNSTRQLTQPVGQIAQQLNVVLSALAGAERIFQIMDTEPEPDTGTVTLVPVNKDSEGTLSECAAGIRSRTWAWKCPHPDGGSDLVELRGAVTLTSVNFGYLADKPVLKDVSVYAKPGQKIAFVGSTGAGKTTIINLLTRFYEIQGGSITYDGIDIRDIKKDSLRASLGMVLQDTHLFTGTVMENIRYGRLEASDEECIQAAKSANAHSFIRRLPQGYQTMIYGDGSNLSQGQRQLLSIARAAVADPPVMVLDEATSSIDTRTERHIEQGMDALMENRTVFVIAHRLSTVRNSNLIAVIEDGRIIEKGSHEELLQLGGRYYELYSGQHELS